MIRAAPLNGKEPFFLLCFSLAAIAMYVPYKPLYWRACISLALGCLYIIYLVMTIKASKTLVKKGHGVVINEPMIFTKIGLKNNTSTIIIQLIVGVILLLFGAKWFINGVEGISLALNISALVLSLLIIPIATELPEKVNSIIWVRKNKDTLGFGNITGAMALQGSILPALGILLTPWQPSREVLTCIIITFFASIWLRINASLHGLLITALLINVCFYLIYIFLIGLIK
ncbi:MAG: sodium:calcium antiporter [Legionella sp.]